MFKQNNGQIPNSTYGQIKPIPRNKTGGWYNEEAHNQQFSQESNKGPTYKFVGQTSSSNKFHDQNPVVEDNSSYTKYYQICVHKNPVTGKYHIRRCILNSRNEIVDAKEYQINKKQYDNILNKHASHEYKLYSTFNLNNIELPSAHDVLLSKSDILNSSYDYYGFAPF
jgi:hypothetical protein